MQPALSVQQQWIQPWSRVSGVTMQTQNNAVTTWGHCILLGFVGNLEMEAESGEGRLGQQDPLIMQTCLLPRAADLQAHTPRSQGEERDTAGTALGAVCPYFPSYPSFVPLIFLRALQLLTLD